MLQTSIGWDCGDWCSSKIRSHRFSFSACCSRINAHMEESLVEEHHSNGTIEVTVREIQKQIRVMKSALEERMKCEVLSRHPILAFSVEHAGRLMLRYEVVLDGCTAYELHAGKPYRRQLVEFWERVCCTPIRPGKTSKIGSQVASADHDTKWSSQKRGMFGDAQRWTDGTFKCLTTLKGTPWNPNLAAGEMSADAFREDMTVAQPAPSAVAPVLVAAAPVDRAASRSYIRRPDAQKYGYSIGCRSVRRARLLVRTLKTVAGCWSNAWLKTKKRKLGQKQRSFALAAGRRVESNQQRETNEKC